MFIDDWMLSDATGITFNAHPPRARQSVIDSDHPWENLGEYSSVIDDGSGQYKMYYLSTRNGTPFVCLATSTDGIQWEKPRLGLHEFQGSRENNIVIWGTGTGSACHDERDPDPRRRYKYFTCQIGDDKPDTSTAEGMVLYNSPDGLHFTKHEVTLLPFNMDSQAMMFWDPYAGKYVCFMRGSDGDIPNSRGRKVVRGETDDPMKPWPYERSPNPNWHNHEIPYVSTELPTVLASDDSDPKETDLYGSQVFLYPWAHRVYLAFPTVYYHFKEGREHLLPGGVPGNVGVGEVQLAVSRDGRKWTRYRRPAYLKSGWHGDIYASWPWVLRGMFRRDERIYQYVSVRRSGHGGRAIVETSSPELRGFSLFEQQPDRFVAADFAYTGGSATTEPFIFEGNRLTLNFDTGAAGEAHVGILREDGTSHESFDIADCDVLNGDYFDKQVAWKGKSDVSALAGKPVRLRFKMRGAALYAFQFRSA